MMTRVQCWSGILVAGLCLSTATAYAQSASEDRNRRPQRYYHVYSDRPEQMDLQSVFNGLTPNKAGDDLSNRVKEQLKRETSHISDGSMNIPSVPPSQPVVEERPELDEDELKKNANWLSPEDLMSPEEKLAQQDELVDETLLEPGVEKPMEWETLGEEMSQQELGEDGEDGELVEAENEEGSALETERAEDEFAYDDREQDDEPVEQSNERGAMAMEPVIDSFTTVGVSEDELDRSQTSIEVDRNVADASAQDVAPPSNFSRTRGAMDKIMSRWKKDSSPSGGEKPEFGRSGGSTERRWKPVTVSGASGVDRSYGSSAFRSSVGSRGLDPTRNSAIISMEPLSPSVTSSSFDLGLSSGGFDRPGAPSSAGAFDRTPTYHAPAAAPLSSGGGLGGFGNQNEFRIRSQLSDGF